MIQMLVYSDASALGVVLVEPVTCLDPARAGTTEYSIVTDYGIGAASTSNCEQTVGASNGDHTFTLTNTTTNETYTISTPTNSLGSEIYLAVVPVGVYTLTDELGNTTDPFTVGTSTAISGFTIVVAKYFVGNDAFTPVPTDVPGNEQGVDFTLIPFLCQTASPDKVGGEYLIFHTIFQSQGAAAAGTTVPNQTCAPGEIRSFQFEAIPLGGGTAIPIPICQSCGPTSAYGFPFGNGIASGYYTIHEITTNTSSEPVYLSSDYTSGLFLWSDLLPTPTATATLTPTETPTATATSVSTETPTATSTSVPTETPTATSTSVPTATATSTTAPTATATATSTTAPTATAVVTGANITLVTSDGGAIPDNGQICIGDTCQSTGTPAGSASVSAAAVSGSTYSFTGLAAGTYPVTVTGVAPYADFTGTITITAGEITNQTITLSLIPVTATAAPTNTAQASPVVSPTTAPGQPTATSAPAKPGPTVAVKSLPNTGQGSSGGTTSFALLFFSLASLLLVVVAIGTRRRRA
jgi:cell division septation protein DedD